MRDELGELTIAEELILLLLKDDTGFVAPVPEWRMSCALVGAVLLDLSFRGRIDTDIEKLHVADATPTGDDMFDPTLATIAAEVDPHGPRYWVERLAANADDINEMVFDRLVQREILDRDTAGFWSLSRQVARSGRYPLVDGAPGEEIRGRIMRTLFDPEEIPDPHDVTVIALVRACDGFRALLPPEEHEEVEERIELIAGMDLLGRAVLSAVQRLLLAARQPARGPSAAADGRFAGVPRVTVAPGRQPAEVPRGEGGAARLRLCAQAARPAFRHTGRRADEPLGGAQGSALPAHPRLPRGLPGRLGYRAVDCQHGRRRPLPDAQGRAGGERPGGGGGPASRTLRDRPGAIPAMGSRGSAPRRGDLPTLDRPADRAAQYEHRPVRRPHRWTARVRVPGVAGSRDGATSEDRVAYARHAPGAPRGTRDLRGDPRPPLAGPARGQAQGPRRRPHGPA